MSEHEATGTMRADMAADGGQTVDPVPARAPSAAKRRSSRARPRGGRGKTRAMDAVITANTQGLPQLVEAFQRVAADGPSVVAVFAQEHHARHDRFADMQAQAKAKGWRAYGSQARISESGPAAGTAVAVKAGRALAAPSTGNVDPSPPSSPGSLAAVWADIGVPGGLLCESVYLHHSEPGSRRNVDIVAAALALAKAHGAMWLMGG